MNPEASASTYSEASASASTDASANVELAHARGFREFLGCCVELSKPGITRLVLVTTFLGIVAAPMPLRFSLVFFALAGTSLVVAGANALNMFLERDSDRFMTRTMGRPLPSGRLAPEFALGFGVSVSMLGLVLLAEGTTMLAVLLAALALLSYVLVYTPLKRLSPAALYVGAIPGAMPPAIGYAAATGSFDKIAFSLFLVLLVWQLPHFLAISIFRRTEYARAKLIVFPNTLGVLGAKRLTVLLSVLFVVSTLMPVFWGVGNLVYAGVALASGAAFVGYSIYGFVAKEEDAWARRLFFFSMPYLVLVLGALVVTN